MNGGYCTKVVKECWCYYSTPTLPSDVCGYEKGYNGRYYSIGRAGSDSDHLPLTIITAVGKKPTSGCTNSHNGCIQDCATNTCSSSDKCQGGAMSCWTNKDRWKRAHSGIVRCTNMEGRGK